MLRHSDNCTGEVVVEENGNPPKKGRRGRKRKMQARRDEDDDEDDEEEDETGIKHMLLEEKFQLQAYLFIVCIALSWKWVI